MIGESSAQQLDIAKPMLEILPGLVRRLNTDVSRVDDTTEDNGGLKDVFELRATPGQISLLRVLVEHGQCSMQELADHLVVTPPTVTAMVKRMLAGGYIERIRDDVDWRTVWVKPTERGKQVVTTFDNARASALCYRLAQLSEDEQKVIAAALPALRHLIEVYS